MIGPLLEERPSKTTSNLSSIFFVYSKPWRWWNRRRFFFPAPKWLIIPSVAQETLHQVNEE
jgi:hypothetical protein